jgi:protein-S-isoprenylcysteine O-methyltransferase Ste14
MGKAARLQHRVERREPARVAWPPQFVVGVFALIVVAALVIYVVLDNVGTSWVAPARQGVGGRIPGALVAVAVGLIVVMPFVPIIDRRLQRRRIRTRR